MKQLIITALKRVIARDPQDVNYVDNIKKAFNRIKIEMTKERGYLEKAVYETIELLEFIEIEAEEKDKKGSDYISQQLSHDYKTYLSEFIYKEDYDVEEVASMFRKINQELEAIKKNIH